MSEYEGKREKERYTETITADEYTNAERDLQDATPTGGDDNANESGGEDDGA